jgi:hypothetical protein
MLMDLGLPWQKVLKIIRDTDTFYAPEKKPDTGLIAGPMALFHFE